MGPLIDAMAARPPVPFEPQADRRGCGAAALAMTCRALGRDVSQADIWAAIARRSPDGVAASRSFELAAFAQGIGLDAAAIRVRDPRAALRACVLGPAIAIVNHRASATSRGGHYSVLVAVEEACVVLHDPRRGPDRRVDLRQFLASWSPDAAGSEVAGHVLVALALPSDEAASCPTCRAPLPATITCPGCRFAIPARPANTLGCGSAGCPGRLWERIYCPRCDAGAIGDAPWWMS